MRVFCTLALHEERAARRLLQARPGTACITPLMYFEANILFCLLAMAMTRVVGETRRERGASQWPQARFRNRYNGAVPSLIEGLVLASRQWRSGRLKV
jgi:hypothetical protein